MRNRFSFRLIWLGLLACAMSFAAPPTIINRTAQWPPQSGPAYSFGGPYEIYYQAVPTSLTDVDTKDSRLIGFCIANTTAGALTFTFQTKDGTPLALPLAGSIAANASACNNVPFGLLAKGGFSVQASGAGLLYSVVWTH